jgi:hypothetical protein
MDLSSALISNWALTAFNKSTDSIMLSWFGEAKTKGEHVISAKKNTIIFIVSLEQRLRGF